MSTENIPSCHLFISQAVIPEIPQCSHCRSQTKSPTTSPQEFLIEAICWIVLEVLLHFSHKYTNTQIHKYTNTQIHICTSAHMLSFRHEKEHFYLFKRTFRIHCQINFKSHRKSSEQKTGICSKKLNCLLTCDYVMNLSYKSVAFMYQMKSFTFYCIHISIESKTNRPARITFHAY